MEYCADMILIIITLAIFLIGYAMSKWKQWRHLPRGPWGLPLLGYLPFLDRKQPHLTLTKLARKYGPMYSISMGSVLAVVLSDYKLVREAFSKEELSGRAPLYLTHGIMEGNGIICAEGILWKDQRKLVNIWLKNSCRSSVRVELDRRIGDNMRQLSAELEKLHKQPLDLVEMNNNYLGNAVNELVFGYTFPIDDPTWQWMRQVQEEGCHEMGVAGVVNFLPFIRHISSSVQKTIDFIKKGQQQTHRVYAKIITMRRELLDLPPPPPGCLRDSRLDYHDDRPDGLIKCTKYSKKSEKISEHFFDPNVLKVSTGECILDNFLREQTRRFEEREDNAWLMNDKQLLYLLADMFGAGLDTSSVTLSWFLLFMALYQDEQDAVRKEVLVQCPDEGCEVDPARLPLMMATLCEVQRIRSIVPVGIPHGCLKDCELGGYLIPKGAMIIPLQWAMHMDPRVWDQPEVFNPKRFLNSNGALYKPQQFMAFQIGKRMCPGEELSRTLIAGMVARLLRGWRVTLADGAVASAPPGRVGVTLQPPRLLYVCERIY